MEGRDPGMEAVEGTREVLAGHPVAAEEGLEEDQGPILALGQAQVLDATRSNSFSS